MSVAVFCEWLGNFGPDRTRALRAEGIVDAIYAYLAPDNAAAQANRRVWNDYGPLWAWIVCSADQEADAQTIADLDARYPIVGWLLNIEKALEGAKLTTLLDAVKATRKPVRASLGGVQTASRGEFDYRALDLADVQVDWQCYFDSGEGPTPAVAVAELWQSSFVVPGWEYRHSWQKIDETYPRYGWGKVVGVDAFEQEGLFDSYRLPRVVNASFDIVAREWGYTVNRRALWDSEGETRGKLMGRARYTQTRVTLDVTRGANDKHSLIEWTAIAASARVKGQGKRPISIYLAEHASDDVLRAISAA